MSACSGRNYNVRCRPIHRFLACCCASRRVQRRKAELTLAQIRDNLPNGWADWHQIWHTCANSYGNGYTPNKLPLETQGGHLGGFRGSTIKKYGESVRLAPTLVHVCGLIWEWTQAKYNSPHNTPGHLGFLGGHQFKCLGKLSNGWTDWHQLWFTSADSSGNGHRLNTIRPSTLGGGGLGGHTFKSQTNMSKGWSDWHQIWYTCADSSGKGYTPNKLP